jgi:ELWxxDGT repeat protein
MKNTLFKNVHSFKLIITIVCILFLDSNCLSAQSLVKDIRPGSQSSSPTHFCKINNQLFFIANNGVNGFELWKSDGTDAGTQMIKDINLGTDDCNLTAITNLNGIAIFSSNNGANGIELWRSDGTEQGTYMIKDIRPWFTGSDINQMITIGNTVYFDADDGTNGKELWKTDGTTMGTLMVKDIAPGFFASTPSYFQNLNGKLIFVANNTFGNEAWVSDGTEAGTFMLADITNANKPFGIYSTPFFTRVGNIAYFAPHKNIFTDMFELWKTDGTSQGTILVSEIKFSTVPSTNKFAALNNKLIFCASSDQQGDEIWVSNGTRAGTTLLKNIRPGSYGSYTKDLTVLNNHIYFSANDGTNYSELWRTDGTPNGTYMVKDIHIGLSSEIKSLYTYNNKLYFKATDGTGVKAWRSDGTKLGTVYAWPNRNIIHEVTDTNGDTIIATVNNTLFFRNNTGDIELWKYNDPLLTSISSIKHNDIEIYPNPARNLFTVNTSEFESGNIKIIDLNGRVILTENINQRDNIQFDLALANGVYIIELENQSMIARKKLIVNN